MIRRFDAKDMNDVIRLAREHGKEAGIDKVLPIDDVYFTNALRNILIDDQNELFIAETGGQIVGYALIGVTNKIWNKTMYGDIFFFYIHEGIRNKFLADSLFDSCQRWFKEQGCRFMECSVSLFDDQFKGIEKYIDRSSMYYENKGCNWAGNHYVVDLEA